MSHSKVHFAESLIRDNDIGNAVLHSAADGLTKRSQRAHK